MMARYVILAAGVVAGAICVTVGVWWMWPPAGLTTGGLSVWLVCWLLIVDTGSGDEPPPPRHPGS